MTGLLTVQSLDSVLAELQAKCCGWGACNSKAISAMARKLLLISPTLPANRLKACASGQDGITEIPMGSADLIRHGDGNVGDPLSVFPNRGQDWAFVNASRKKIEPLFADVHS
jgi:hypothetical protein